MARESSVFNDLLDRGLRKKQIPALTKRSRRWFRSRALRTRGIDRNDVINDPGLRRRPGIEIGRMYFYDYSNPKHKKTLPYFDAFPLVFPFNYANGLIYGINLHHAPYKYRAKIMDSLYALRTDDRLDEKTKLRMSYQTLKRITSATEIKPIIRSYYPDRIKSRFIEVSPTEWDIALFLPVAEYRKQDGSFSREAVFKDYRRKLRKLR